MNGAEIVNAVREFFEVLFADFATLWYWPLIFIGLMIVYVIIMLFIIRFSYENRILKNINRLNKYFIYKPYITEDNLVEFNQKMKKAPRVLRSAWQRYMLNREDGVKEYINIATCIDKPLRTSSIEKNIKGYTVFTTVLLLLAFITGLQFCTVNYAQASLSTIIFISLLLPTILLLLYSIFILIFNASKDDIYSVMYDNFPLFQYNLEKAVTKMPSYVDYEILFTSKEIKEGIPILQQYLEKRAIVEQEQLEKARRDSIVSEEYDFSGLGVDGSFLLEKAMKESESFIKIKRMLQEESNSIETEKENYRKTYEENFKDMQRKLQASRENMDSLKKQQEESTNRIETNYIRKQLADEIKKQQQLEKEIEQATLKFTEEQASLENEIKARNEEIEEKKAFVEQAMILTFKHYANTLYKALLNKATEVSNERLIPLTEENNDLRALLIDLECGVEDNYYDDNANLISPQELSINTPYNISEEENQALEVLNKEIVNQDNSQDSFVGDQGGDAVEEYYQQGVENNLDTYQPDNAYQDNVDTYQENGLDGQNNADIYQSEGQNAVTEDVLINNDSTDNAKIEVEPVEAQPVNASNKEENIEEAKIDVQSQLDRESDENIEKVHSSKVEVQEDDALDTHVDEIQNEKSAKDAEKELEIIQKEIEKENDKLKKEKEDLTTSLTSTLDKFSKKEFNKSKKDKENIKTENKASAKRSATKKSATKKASTKRREQKDDDDDINGLDALNIEMAKLLSKTKKD